MDIFLKKIGFSNYDSEALSTLIKHKNLTAKDLLEYTDIPQPKIHETLDRLEIRGFIDKISYGNQKIYTIKSKQEIIKKIEDLLYQQKELGEQIISTIEKLYNTSKNQVKQLISLAGERSILYNLKQLIRMAESSIISILPLKININQIVDLLKIKSEKIQVDFIFYEMNSLREVQSFCPKARFFKINDKSSTIFNRFIKEECIISNPSKEINTFSKKLRSMVKNPEKNFGLFLIDTKNILYFIPVYSSIPIAVISDISGFVNFFYKGLKELVESSKQIKNLEKL